LHQKPLTNKLKSDTSIIPLFENTLKYSIYDLLEEIDVAIWIIDTINNEFLFLSKAMEKIYDTSIQHLLPNNLETMIHPDDKEKLALRKQALLKGEKSIQKYRIITPNGRVKWVKENIVHVKGSYYKTDSLIGYIEDITTFHTLEDQLIHLAYYNGFTQLPNRYYGRQHIKRLIIESNQENKTFGLFYLNIDGMKRINTLFGHAIGDEAIKKIARRIKTFIKDSGVAYHISGDEFIVIVKHCEKLDLYKEIGSKLIKYLKKPLFINGLSIYLTVSIGISVYPTDNMNYEILIKFAHLALNKAKELGKDNVQLFSPSSTYGNQNEYLLENELRLAINNQQVFLEYQPRFDVETKRINGAEALIRWYHPKMGLISPNVFIPLAEETQIIHDIGEFLLDSVCHQIKNWLSEGLSFQTISINFSAKDFLKPDLVDRIRNTLNAYNINPKLLEIEITEGVLLSPNEIVLDQIKKIKELGLRIALDDYGTGYSSIHYLKNYSVDTLKIDRSFIKEIDKNNEDAVIVKSVIDMGKGLKKKIVAEGVETKEQFSILKKLGCDEIQGYYFSRPISGREITKMFKEI
jgi:diguanylate cyclase (GGDEF)-like protein/PAS domain S-box-containing protein